MEEEEEGKKRCFTFFSLSLSADVGKAQTSKTNIASTERERAKFGFEEGET